MDGEQMKTAAALLAQSRIFRGATTEGLERYLSQPGAALCSFARGAAVCLPGERSGSLGMLLTGSAQVSKGTDGHQVLMSTLQRGDLFGAVTLYGTNDYYLTRITARTPCAALFLDKALVDAMLQQSPQAARQYIAYLSDRIYFLNSKIDAFTGGTAETRLAAYLLANRCQEDGGAFVRLETSMNQLTRSLDIARASLYRAMERLEEAGAIRRDGRVIAILDIQKLRDCCEG